jgi:hypothetical protein
MTTPYDPQLTAMGQTVAGYARKAATTKSLVTHFSRKYFEGGYRHSDWFTLIAKSDGEKTLFYKEYYANMGTMRAEISEEDYSKALTTWMLKTLRTSKHDHAPHRGLFTVTNEIREGN